MIAVAKWDIITTKPSAAEQRQWARFRGWTIRILQELEHSGGLTVPQLSDILGKERHYIRRYCYNLVSVGALEPVERWGFRITITGLNILLLQAGETKEKERRKKGETKEKQRQLTLTPFTDSKYSEPEIVITNLLISHYNETGQPFIFIEDKYELCETVGFPPEVVASAIRRLFADKVCYIFKDPTYGGQQLRLFKPFLERQQYI